MTPDQPTIRPLREDDLADADRIMRLAFGTYHRLPDPLSFMGDADYVRSRRTASPASAFGAEIDGKLVGSSFATRWGSFGFFGPLTIDPEYWNRGLAAPLIQPVIETLDVWQVTHAGLFTLADSAKHVALYQKFGFRPRALTLILEKDVDVGPKSFRDWTTLSGADPAERPRALADCRRLTDDIYAGLDVTPEIESIAAQSLGDTILLAGNPVEAFAACHTGAGSEAGSRTLYVKFGAVGPHTSAGETFGRLLGACESFAAEARALRLVAGINVARQEAYEAMMSRGFRILRTGVSMHRPNEAGFNRAGVFVIDDWR